MIFCGYQGVGKSSIAHPLNKTIDLESSNFFIDGERCKDWYKIYISIADHLSNQGYDVFISSHKNVREYLNECNIDFCCIFPALSLKEEWIKRLSDRYQVNKSDKNFKALKNAEEMFEENIKDLSNEKMWIEIKNIDYDLNYETKMFKLFLEEDICVSLNLKTNFKNVNKR